LYQINQTVLKKALLLLLPLVMFSCKDYDAQFDELTNMVASLEADNRALESQIAEVQAQDALIAQEISARLTEFETAISIALAQIGAGVTQVGTGVTGSVEMLQGIMAQLQGLLTAIGTDGVTNDDINTQLDSLEKMLEEVQKALNIHSSGGSHTSGGN
jgi:DNA repair exonuclease SbcCD ATPase subunit